MGSFPVVPSSLAGHPFICLASSWVGLLVHFFSDKVQVGYGLACVSGDTYVTFQRAIKHWIKNVHLPRKVVLIYEPDCFPSVMLVSSF